MSQAQGSIPAQTTNLPQVRAQMAHLKDQINYLRIAYTDLRQRLETVLTPIGDIVAPPIEKVPEPEQVPLADEIRADIKDLSGILVNFKELMDHIEL